MAPKTRTEIMKAKQRSLYLFGEIDENSASQIITVLNEETGWSSIETLNFYISSRGGDLHMTFAIIDLIEAIHQKHRFSINTHGLGVVGSGGFFLFLLGKSRYLYPKCRMYVHEHICVDSEELPFSLQDQSHEEDRQLNKMYTEWIAERLGISFKKAKELLMLNKWLNEKEIEKFNIVTRK